MFALTGLLVILTVVVLFILVSKSTRDDEGSGLHILSSTPSLTIEEILDLTDAIAVGTVGDELLKDYPMRYTSSQYSSEELGILGGDRYFKRFPAIYYDFGVEEVWLGELKNNIPILVPDVDQYARIDFGKVEPGQHLLVFMLKNETSYSDAPYPIFYTTHGDQGIFDIVGNQARVRNPKYFMEQPYWDSIAVVGEDSLVSYFHLDRLKDHIQKGDAQATLGDKTEN